MSEKLDQLDDLELMALISDHHRAAFSVLVKRHTDKFYALAYRTLASKSEAEDIVQQAFLKLWEKPQSFKAWKGVKFTTWFYRIVLNLSIDANRKKKPVALPEGFDVADDQPESAQILEMTSEAQMIETVIRSLPERQQQALNLCFYEELPQKEAAAIMQVSVKALESLLMRAKKNLKESLQSRYDNDREEFRHATA